jgi:hypothetical protein
MNSDFRTVAETSDFAETGRIEEVDRLCELMADQWPQWVRALEFGRSAEERPMRALIVSRCGTLTAEALRERRIPVLMIQAGIHPGESDGKDAGFIALRELLQQPGTPDPLEDIALLFVPAFNTDGHERVGQWNRPNQNGPRVTGWRSTSQNLNLNRDYTKADAPEMRAMLTLINGWDPLICADLHVTDGADFEPDVSIQVEPINQGDPSLWMSGRTLRERLIAELAEQGSVPLPFYPDLFETDNPASGFVLTVYSPRFSTGYFPQRNRFTVLVETHSWKPYAKRVQVTRNTILGLAKLTAMHGRAWLEEVNAADASACNSSGTSLTLDYQTSWREPMSSAATSRRSAPEGQTIEFRGYAYSREVSAISGALVTVYKPGEPAIWRVPYRNRIEPSLVIRAPKLGYIVPQAYAREVKSRLEIHGIETALIPEDLPHEALSLFKAAHVVFSTQPVEGRMRATIDGEWHPLDIEMAALGFLVPIRQRLARLVVALLEPRAPDSLAAWGVFNMCFERKEYLEPYVAEQIARDMLAADPELRKTFEYRLASDEAFRNDPAARFEFFWRRHPSWDRSFNCYPIYRI